MAWGWIKKLFGPVAPLAPVIANMFVPGIGPLVSTVVNCIIMAEERIGGGNGPEKAKAVADYLTVAAPMIIDSIEKSTGKELVDNDLFEAGTKDITEGIVKMLNAFRLLPKTS